MKTPNAVIYTRVSTDDQAENGTSLASQLAACLQRAEKLGARVVKRCEDAGISGALYTMRPGLQEALQAIECGQASVLIVYSISRLSRDREHQSTIQKRIRQAGGSIVYCDMSVEDTPEGSLLVNITGDFAQYERELFRKRTMTGRRRRAEEGVQPCRAPWMQPYGYKVPTKMDVMNSLYRLEDLGKYIIVEEEAQWVREIFSRYAAGNSLRSVAHWLNESGVSTPRDGQYWRESTVKRIIDNPVYKGAATFGKHRRVTDEALVDLGYTNGSRILIAPEEERVCIDAPAIIDAEIWAVCQQRLIESKQLFGGRPDRRYLLRGLLLCPVCRRSMVCRYRERKRKSGSVLIEHDYQCRDSRASRNAGRVVCHSVHYSACEVETIVLNTIRQIAREPELMEAALLAYRTEDKTESLEKDRERVTKALEALQSKEKATIAAQIRGIQAGADPSLYDEVFAQIAEERCRLSDRLIEIDQERGKGPTKEEVNDHVRLLAEAFADVEEALTAPELTIPERHGLIARLIKDVVPEDGQYKISLRSTPQTAQTVATIRTL